MEKLRESSKRGWVSNKTIEHINAGSLQRIADATELMTKNYVDCQDTRDTYQRWYKEEQAKTQKLALRVAALKGVITKLKKVQAVRIDE